MAGAARAAQGGISHGSSTLTAGTAVVHGRQTGPLSIEEHRTDASAHTINTTPRQSCSIIQIIQIHCSILWKQHTNETLGNCLVPKEHML